MPPLSDLAADIQLNSSWKEDLDQPEEKHYATKRLVRFNDDVEINVIPIVPDEFKLCYWMDKEDYVKIRLEVLHMVETTLSQCATASKDFRGLEYKTPQGIYRRHLNRRRATNAVMQEQLFQFETGYSDPDWIASVYRENTHRSQIEAKIMGMRDEIAIKHEAILNKRENFQDFKKQNFIDFKSMAISYVMSERMEL